MKGAEFNFHNNNESPILIALGDIVYEYLIKYFNEGYMIVKIKHYSASIKGGAAGYRELVTEALSKYNILI